MRIAILPTITKTTNLSISIVPTLIVWKTLMVPTGNKGFMLLCSFYKTMSFNDLLTFTNLSYL